MALNTIDAWVPELWAAMTLSHLRSNMGFSRMLYRNYESQLASYGETVNIPLPPTLAAKTKLRGQATVADDVEATTIPVSLNKHPYVKFEFDDVDLLKSKTDAMAVYSESAAIALKEHIEGELLAEYVNASKSLGADDANIGLGTLNRAQVILTKNKAPMQNRVAFISPDAWGVLSDSLTQTQITPVSGDQSALRTGSIGQIKGFDIYQSQLVNTTELPAEAGFVSHGIAMHREAVTLVSRPLRAPEAGTGAVGVVVQDPDIGMSFRVMMAFDSDKHVYKVTYDAIYGVKTLRPEFMLEIKQPVIED